MLKSKIKTTNHLLDEWFRFRQQLETSNSPLEDVHEYFSKHPTIKVYTDPYDQSTWPTPWELIDENEYCSFNKILAVCYTLQLTTAYQNHQPKIAIAIDNSNKTVYYLLFLDDKVYGYDFDGWISVQSLPKTLKTIKIYDMEPLH